MLGRVGFEYEWCIGGGRDGSSGSDVVDPLDSDEGTYVDLNDDAGVGRGARTKTDAGGDETVRNDALLDGAGDAALPSGS